MEQVYNNYVVFWEISLESHNGFCKPLSCAQSDERQRYSILQVKCLNLGNCDEKPKYVLALIPIFHLNADPHNKTFLLWFAHIAQ